MKWHEEQGNGTPAHWYYVDGTGRVVATVVTRKSGYYVYEGVRDSGHYIDMESAKAAVERAFQ